MKWVTASWTYSTSLVQRNQRDINKITTRQERETEPEARVKVNLIVIQYILKESGIISKS